MSDLFGIERETHDGTPNPAPRTFREYDLWRTAMERREEHQHATITRLRAEAEKYARQRERVGFYAGVIYALVAGSVVRAVRWAWRRR